MASSNIRNSNSPVVNDLNYLNDLYYTDIYSNSALLGHGILLYYHCTTTVLLLYYHCTTTLHLPIVPELHYCTTSSSTRARHDAAAAAAVAYHCLLIARRLLGEAVILIFVVVASHTIKKVKRDRLTPSQMQPLFFG